MWVLVFSIVLLPIAFETLKYFILLGVILVCFNVVQNVYRLDRITYSPIFAAVASFVGIYLVWWLITLSYGNDLIYAFKDSAGFPVYLVFPFLFLFVVLNRLESNLLSALMWASLAVAAIHIVVFIGFYAVFGKLTFANLSGTNAFLGSIGLNWELGATNGILRANTKSGHFLLLGLGLIFYRYVVTKRPIYLAAMGVLIIGALLDGHKALVVSAVLLGMMLVPIVVIESQRYPIRFLTIALLLGCVLVATFSQYLDLHAWLGRFGSIDSSSFQVRSGQVEALLAKISDHPFFGNGFGSYANIIRSDERPFMYEVDFLAVMMKLGVVGCATYFLTYFYVVTIAARTSSLLGYILFSTGMAYFFYMGTNGGFAMSPITAFFHILFFGCIAIAIRDDTLARTTIFDAFSPSAGQGVG